MRGGGFCLFTQFHVNLSYVCDGLDGAPCRFADQKINFIPSTSDDDTSNHLPITVM